MSYQVGAKLKGYLAYVRGGFADHYGFPRVIHIENTNHCNSRCTICPMDIMTRPKGVMNMELFQKLISEISHHYRSVKELHLHGFGEPLMDKNLIEKIKLAKLHKIKFVYLVTNASLLTPELSKAIVFSGLDEFKISFYGMRKETYEAIHRGLNFEKTLFNIEEFLKIRASAGRGPAVRMQFAKLDTNENEMLEFIHYWRERIACDYGDKLFITRLHNWAGGKGFNEIRRSEEERKCSWPFRSIQILWNGIVVPCVYDYNGETLMGDVNIKSIKSVWTGNHYEKFRDVWRGQNSFSADLCKKCDEPEHLFQPRPIPYNSLHDR